MIFKKRSLEIIKILPQEVWKLSAVKNYLRVSHDYDDDLIAGLIDAAINVAENFIGLCIIKKQVKFTTNHNQRIKIKLPYKPILQILSVSFGAQNDLQDYDFDSKTQEFRVDNIHGEDLIIEYLIGFETQDIPPAIKHGIMLHIANMYDREEQGSFLMPEVKNLYMQYREIKI